MLHWNLTVSCWTAKGHWTIEARSVSVQMHVCVSAYVLAGDAGKGPGANKSTLTQVRLLKYRQLENYQPDSAVLEIDIFTYRNLTRLHWWGDLLKRDTWWEGEGKTSRHLFVCLKSGQEKKQPCLLELQNKMTHFEHVRKTKLSKPYLSKSTCIYKC